MALKNNVPSSNGRTTISATLGNAGSSPAGTTKRTVIKICNSGNCQHELGSGKCGKRRDDVCPESFETDEEYEAARQDAEDREDLRGDYLWEQEKDRRLGI